MELEPKDKNIQQWIGDLLFEGYSYSDSLKAYRQVKAENMSIYVLGKRLKTEIRIESMNQIQKTINLISK